jgi:hypothetical protein
MEQPADLGQPYREVRKRVTELAASLGDAEHDATRGTLLLMGGTGNRHVGPGRGIASAATAAMPPFTAALALEGTRRRPRLKQPVALRFFRSRARSPATTSSS